MKAISRAFVTVIASAATLLASAGISHAGLDDELSLVDGQGRTLTVQQWDIFLDGVSPLDRNRLTREWFHSGQAKYTVSGPGAEDFEGTLILGYEVGFPWSLGVAIGFSYTTPNVLLDDVTPEQPLQADTPNLLPGVNFSADLGNGPGVQEISTFEVDVSGSAGGVAVSKAHGTVTGAAGGVLLRPFARLVASTGDLVTTYGEPWNMN
ncbi:porin MspA [Mycolicibacterium madagascariense]|uniref:Porin MspA n=1 Tax=Mycolicibacterium madagascariense TaxID=212765 RepID=A0A7I7XLT3_9MYCO|nr:MspA family porin [Mycolicibacterium madagascariense]MCV7012509.1 MspA family porin [Mycolicibacterium madagascariense]BBZ30189.1 porin MspA [Mycolicibacterium madagascariense]